LGAGVDAVVLGREAREMGEKANTASRSEMGLIDALGVFGLGDTGTGWHWGERVWTLAET
jgi:hypothetical protein